MEQEFMKEKPVFPLVASMSLPMVLSMLVNALYNIVDSYFVAKVSEDAMTALSLVFPLQNLLTAAGVGFGIGINAVAAYELGAQKPEAASKAISQGIFFNAIHGVFLTVVCIVGMPAFLRLFTEKYQVLDYGVGYSNIVFLFSCAVTIGVSFEKIFQAVGKMKVSMLCMLSGCVVNIILDPILIFGFAGIPAMGIHGAALATGIGQIVALLAYMIIFWVRPLPVRIIAKKSLFEDAVYRRIYAVGIPAALNMALPSFLITALNGILASFSGMYVLILGIYYKLQTFIYLTANGIVQGIRPLISYNYGAQRSDRVRAVFKTALLLGSIIMAMGTMFSLAFPERLMKLFSDNLKTITYGAQALRVISCGFVVSAVSVMVSGTFEGLGKGMPSLVISLIRYIALIPIAYLLSVIFGAVGVWNAFWVTEILAAAVSLIMIRLIFAKMVRE